MLHRWTNILIDRARLVVALGVVATIAAATYGLGVFDSLGQGGFDDPGTDSSKELTREQELFGNKNVDVVAIYRSKTLIADDPAFEREVQQVLAGVPEGTTTSVVTAWDSGDPAMISTDGHAVQVLISIAGETQNDQADNLDLLAPQLEADDRAGPGCRRGTHEPR
jgi:RND superfamily putative drug exporter